MRTKKISAVMCMVFVLVVLFCVPVYASGDVAGAIEGTWQTASQQIKTVVDHVVFPAIDLILAVFFFGKLGTAYFDYRKHGQFEWAAPAILFACLVFTLTAPLISGRFSEFRRDVMGCWGITAFESDTGLDAIGLIRNHLPEQGDVKLQQMIDWLRQILGMPSGSVRRGVSYKPNGSGRTNCKIPGEGFFCTGWNQGDKSFPLCLLLQHQKNPFSG